VAQVVECLPSQHKALTLNPNTENKDLSAHIFLKYFVLFVLMNFRVQKGKQKYIKALGYSQNYPQKPASIFAFPCIDLLQKNGKKSTRDKAN
jgi:hypothetical protein